MTESAGITVTSDGTMPCPVPSPGGLPCVKRIPQGWTADEGHGGGHFWMSPETSQALARGHYDATAALAGEPFTIDQPEDCTPGCPQYEDYDDDGELLPCLPEPPGEYLMGVIRWTDGARVAAPGTTPKAAREGRQ